METKRDTTENMQIAKSGGESRKAAESRTGTSVITPQNVAQQNAVVTNMIEGVVAINADNSTSISGTDLKK